jgi:hypothetical protein
MREKDFDNASDTAQRIQQNVSNLPLTSMALAGLVGAGAVALFASFKSRRNSF